MAVISGKIKSINRLMEELGELMPAQAGEKKAAEAEDEA